MHLVRQLSLNKVQMHQGSLSIGGKLHENMLHEGQLPLRHVPGDTRV